MDDDTYNALLARAVRALSVDASPQAAKQAEERLARLSSVLLLEWLVGERRFESQSQQTEFWLSRFYEEIFPDEQPDPTKIYERFGVSLPRAGYIARLLRARRVAQWRAAARLELATQLERNRAKAEEAKREGQAHIQEFDISLSPGAADELRVLYDRIASFAPDRERPKPPRPKVGFGTSKWLSIPAETLLSLLESLKSEQ